MTSNRNKIKVAVAAAVVVAVGGGTTVAMSSSGELRSSSPEPETPTVAAASPAARASFSVLGQSDLRGEAKVRLAALDAGKLPHPEQSPPGTNTETAKAARQGAGARIVKQLGARAQEVAFARTVGPLDVLVAPGSGGLCTISNGPKGGASGCSSEEEAASGNAFTSFGCLQQNDLVAYGLVPDDAEDVTVTTRGGKTSPLGVANNVAGVAVPASTAAVDIPRTVTWVTDAGTVKAELPIPADPTC